MMATKFSRITLALLMLGIPWAAHPRDETLRVQYSNAAGPLVGTWQSGNFAYTFRDDGTYVYVGAMGGSAMETRISEQGTYRIEGQNLIIIRQNGLITNSNNYRQNLKPQTTIFPFVMLNSPNGPALRLTFPTGNQVFYRR
jgi:hypothetical protein